MSVENLTVTVRSAVAKEGKVRELKMFGGVGFMLNGNLLVAASHRGLLVRVGKDRHHEALARPGARPMVMRGRTMAGYIRVDREALDEHAARSWVQLAVEFVRTLPPKVSRSSPKRARRKQR